MNFLRWLVGFLTALFVVYLCYFFSITPETMRSAPAIMQISHILFTICGLLFLIVATGWSWFDE